MLDPLRDGNTNMMAIATVLPEAGNDRCYNSVKSLSSQVRSRQDALFLMIHPSCGSAVAHHGY